MSETQSCYWPRALIHVRTGAALADVRALRRLMSGYGLHARPHDQNQWLVDITHRQQRDGSPPQLADDLLRRLSRDLPDEELHLGVAHEPILAACASAIAAGGALEVIAPWEVQERLRPLPTHVLSSIHPSLARFMTSAGLRQCGQIADLQPTIVRRHFGLAGAQLWRLCRRGYGGTTVEIEITPLRIRLQAVLPPQTRSHRALGSHLRRIYLEAVRTLRSHRRRAGVVGLRAWIEGRRSLVIADLPSLEPTRFRWIPARLTERLFELCGGHDCLMLQLDLGEVENPGPQLELFAADQMNSSAKSAYGFTAPVENSLR